MLRWIVTLVVTTLLAGCVLQSPAPIFPDSNAKLVFGNGKLSARIYSRKDGQWVMDEKPVTLRTSGHHYAVETEGVTIELFFIPLDGRWHVVQAMEKGKPTVYMLAEVQNHRADFRILSCTDLKKHEAVAKSINFNGEDCFIKPKEGTKALFKALIKMPGAPSSRLEIANPS
ncbi:MAG: hypothetical protein KDK89_19690 [Alphaproteobacteria bacterium]|nr:hypothetical protein [Alphaproteobacteria bacterium]